MNINNINNQDTSGMFERSPSENNDRESSSLIDKPHELQTSPHPYPDSNLIGAPLPNPIPPSNSVQNPLPSPYPVPYSPQPLSSQANSPYQSQGSIPVSQVQPVILQPQQLPNNTLNVPLISSNINEKTTFDIIEILQDLREASSANITKILDLNCCNEGCLLLPLYNVSIVNRKNLQERRILMCKAVEDCCHPGPMEIRMKYIPRDISQNYITVNNYDLRLFDFKTAKASGNGCCEQKPNSSVYYNYNGQLLGEILQPLKCRCCCSDPIFEIKSNSEIKRYVITTDGSQCAYCCCTGCCCSNNSISFPVYNALCSQIVGEIFKDVFTRRRIPFGEKDRLKWRVNFPLDAFPEDKILLIAAAILIDFQEYRGIGAN